MRDPGYYNHTEWPSVAVQLVAAARTRDTTTILILADWFDEQAAPDRAAYMRLLPNPHRRDMPQPDPGVWPAEAASVFAEYGVPLHVWFRDIAQIKRGAAWRHEAVAFGLWGAHPLNGAWYPDFGGSDRGVKPAYATIPYFLWYRAVTGATAEHPRAALSRAIREVMSIG